MTVRLTGHELQGRPYWSSRGATSRAAGEREEFMSATVVFILADNQSVDAARVDKDPPQPSSLEA
jgi:hypothetical protein